ncbi:hypothetical protein AFK68_16270 [Hydrocoleum sp. CS-953]|nr:hypothetical protein AFK68_16270 [Hydrocoleum sp. CS-953]
MWVKPNPLTPFPLKGRAVSFLVKVEGERGSREQGRIFHHLHANFPQRISSNNFGEEMDFSEISLI